MLADMAKRRALTRIGDAVRDRAPDLFEAPPVPYRATPVDELIRRIERALGERGAG